MRILRLLALLAFTLPVARLQAQELHTADRAQLATELGDHLAAYHAIGRFSGTALVADEGKVIYQGSFGLANEDWDIANSKDTKFRLASISKQFTAMLVLLLVEDGQLELEAPILRYLPDYPAEVGNKVTLHHLLNHTSGIPSYTQRPGFMQKDSFHHYTVAEFVDRYCTGPLEFEPGTEFHYNNSGYYLLGAIVEAVTGSSYIAALREHVLQPLEMRDTGFDDQSAVMHDRATGYDEILGERRLARWMDMSNAYAAGALYSTVGDLWKWDQALRSQRLLAGHLEQRMFAPGLGNYGYGWFINRSNPDQVQYRHGGGINGFSTLIARIPSRGRCVILLSNLSTSAVNNAAKGLGAILQGDTPPPPTQRLNLSLARTVLDDGIEAALGSLAEISPQTPSGRLEQEINNLGYQLLGRMRWQEAVRIFEFNTQAFPDSANVWDSLGEAHMNAGNHQLAINNYRRALELDPLSKTVPALLEKLEGAPTEKPVVKSPVTDSYFRGTDKVTSSQGPMCITRNVAQDNEGNIWLATWEGIVRYDGSSFTNFTNQESLARARAFSVLKDRSGAMWFGTTGAGVYRYAGKSFTHFSTDDGLVGNTVICMLEDSAGRICFGTSSGISRFDGSSFQNFTTADGLSSNRVTTLMEDQSGQLWVGTRGEASTYDGEKFVTIERSPGATFTNVRSIIEDRDGTIWLGGNDGLWSLAGESFTRHLPNFIGSIYEDRQGSLWISTSDLDNMYEMTLCRYGGRSAVIPGAGLVKVAEPAGQVFGVFEDASGNIWFGTERGASFLDGPDSNGTYDAKETRTRREPETKGQQRGLRVR